MQSAQYGTKTVDYRQQSKSRYRPKAQLKRKKTFRRKFFSLIMLSILFAGAIHLGAQTDLLSLNFLSKKYYHGSDFGIETVYSSMDYNENGIDDYSDIVIGARAEIKRKPTYDGVYQNSAYPPESIGVCTDVIWRAFRDAGYNIKNMVDADISAHTELYPSVNGRPDPNIDFRRVPNLKVFFERYGQSLTLDPNDYGNWQPGDIVTYGTTHIAIVSDRRNENGRPYILHNGGEAKEADELTSGEISGHYRFDASKIKSAALISSDTII